MKKIKLVDLKTFDGEIMTVNAENKNLNVKDVLLNHLGMFHGKNGKESILAYTIGQKIAGAKKEIELEDAEYELIKRALDRQPPIMTALGVGQTLKIMEGQEEKKGGK